MIFLKQNKFFFSAFLFTLVVFSCLQFVSCNSGENLEAMKSSINSELRKRGALQEELLLYEGLAEESKTAIDDMLNLANTEKEQHRFWSNILNSSQNIFSSWKKKSPEAINADLTRLYSHLRSVCKRSNIHFEQEERNNVNLFGSNNQNDGKKYGFGLSSYDGFWPSFSKDEAKMLGIQSKIIASLIEFLSESSNSEHKINLIKISRESAGSEDSQHIAGDILAIPNLSNKLVRFTGGIKTFAFLIKFKSHTSHARSFINQLRPPFLLRDLKVNRSEVTTLLPSTQSVPDPFSSDNKTTEMSLPIVQNVESVFTLLIEYVYFVERDFESFIVTSLKNENINEETLTKFLESSGNSQLRSKLNKILTNREVR